MHYFAAFTDSLIVTKAFLGPGTAPLITLRLHYDFNYKSLTHFCSVDTICGISTAGFAASEIRIDRHRKITPTHDNAADPRRHEI